MRLNCTSSPKAGFSSPQLLSMLQEPEPRWLFLLSLRDVRTLCVWHGGKCLLVVNIQILKLTQIKTQHIIFITLLVVILKHGLSVLNISQVMNNGRHWNIKRNRKQIVLPHQYPVESTQSPQSVDVYLSDYSFPFI